MNSQETRAAQAFFEISQADADELLLRRGANRHVVITALCSLKARQGDCDDAVAVTHEQS